MIEVTLTHFILLLGGVYVVAGFFGWVVNLFRRSHKARQKPNSVILCRICGVRYEALEGEVTPCPSCNTPNEISPSDAV